MKFHWLSVLNFELRQSFWRKRFVDLNKTVGFGAGFVFRLLFDFFFEPCMFLETRCFVITFEEAWKKEWRTVGFRVELLVEVSFPFDIFLPFDMFLPVDDLFPSDIFRPFES